MAEAGHRTAAAVDAREIFILAPAAERDSPFNDGGEVLILSDMYQFGEGDHLGGEDAVRVRGFYRHQTVCGEEDGGGDVRELTLLILPGGAEIALEVRIFFQFRVGVRRQHFTVGVDVDALARALFEQQLQVAQVVAADDDKGALLNFEGDGGRLRRPVGLRIGAV